MDQRQNSKEEALKRKHSEEDDPYYYPSSVRAKTSSPNELTPHHPIISSHPPSLNPFLSDHTIISPRLGFLPLEQELLPKLTTKPKNTTIDFLGLSPPSQLVVSNQEAIVDPPLGPPPRPPHTRGRPTQGPKQKGKSETITPPFPWATNHRAVVHNFNYLLRNKILTITGDVSCKRCERKFKMEFDLKEKFSQVWKFITENRNDMHDRAPDIWMNPVLPKCMHCGQENCVKPITQDVKKKSLNWLFLLLGQMLGCCTLEQLKYFCKHTKNHRTGAKDRVLYLTYLALCKQLDPQGPFDR